MFSAYQFKQFSYDHLLIGFLWLPKFPIKFLNLNIDDSTSRFSIANRRFHRVAPVAILASSGQIWSTYSMSVRFQPVESIRPGESCKLNKILASFHIFSYTFHISDSVKTLF